MELNDLELKLRLLGAIRNAIKRGVSAKKIMKTIDELQKIKNLKN